MYMLANQTNAKHFSQTKPSKTFWHNKSCSDKSRKTICWQIKLYFGNQSKPKFGHFDEMKFDKTIKKVPQAGQPVLSPTSAVKTDSVDKSESEQNEQANPGKEPTLDEAADIIKTGDANATTSENEGRTAAKERTADNAGSPDGGADL